MPGVTLGDALAKGISMLEAQTQHDWYQEACGDPKVDARALLLAAADITTTTLYTWPEKLLTPAQWQAYQRLLEGRAAGQPVAYLIGYREFWSMRLKVAPSTLIPRPATESLVEAALNLDLPSHSRVLDLGTGTGALALALASERAHWRISGCDFNPEAVSLATENAASLGLGVTFFTSNWFQAVEPRDFALIVSNPPYVEADSPYLAMGDVRFEPDSALTAGPDGLEDIRQLVAQAPGYLAPQGWLMLEHGHQQGAAVQALMQTKGYSNIHTGQDMDGNDRFTLGQWRTQHTDK